jgi:hypothetical protein
MIDKGLHTLLFDDNNLRIHSLILSRDAEGYKKQETDAKKHSRPGCAFPVTSIK